jgi:hypothetical protein
MPVPSQARLIEMIIQNPVFGISCIISMLAHSTSRCLTSFTNIQKYSYVMSLFNTIPRTKRSHGHKRIQHPNVKKSSKPKTLQDTFNDLLSNIQKPLGIYHIRTILFSLSVNYPDGLY